LSDHAEHRVRPLVRVAAAVLALMMIAFTSAMIVALIRSASASRHGQHFQWKGFVIAPVILFGFWRYGRSFFVAAWTGQSPRWGRETDDNSHA